MTNETMTADQALDEIMNLFREIKGREIRAQRLAAMFGPQVIPFRVGDRVTSTEYKGTLRIVSVDYEAVNGRIVATASICKLRNDGSDANKFFKTNTDTLTKAN